MNKVIVTLKNGIILNTNTEYCWGYEEKINDTRTPFIQIENLLINKNEISTIEIVKQDEEEEK